MRLTNLEIKDIHRGTLVRYHDDIDRNSKLLVLHTEGGHRINILLGVGRSIDLGLSTLLERSLVLTTPSRYLHQAHLAISYDFLLRRFSIVKNLMVPSYSTSSDGQWFNTINQINDVLLEQFIDMGFNRCDTYYIISKLCHCFNLTTGEHIFFSRQSPYGGTRYDLHINGENVTDATVYIGKGIDTITPIKKEIRHNFLN